MKTFVVTIRINCWISFGKLNEIDSLLPLNLSVRTDKQISKKTIYWNLFNSTNNNPARHCSRYTCIDFVWVLVFLLFFFESPSACDSRRCCRLFAIFIIATHNCMLIILLAQTITGLYTHTQCVRVTTTKSI